MKRIAATLAVTAAIVGAAPGAALAAGGDSCGNGKLPLFGHLLVPFC